MFKICSCNNILLWNIYTYNKKFKEIHRNKTISGWGSLNRGEKITCGASTGLITEVDGNYLFLCLFECPKYFTINF